MANSRNLIVDLKIFGWAWSSLKNEFTNSAIFLHAETNQGKLKVILIIFGWGWSKIDVAYLSYVTLKST